VQAVYIHSILILRAAGCALCKLPPSGHVSDYDASPPGFSNTSSKHSLHKYTIGIADAPWGPDVLVNLVCWHI